MSAGNDQHRTAIVTGGGSGIGAATAAALIDDGWRVVICGRRREALESVAEQTGAHPVVADVGQAADIGHLVSATIAAFGRLDGLVLNAGIVLPGAAGDLSDEDWDAMVSTNLSGQYS